VMGFFEIRSQGLFASTGFEQRHFWFLSPEQLGLQAWTTGTWVLCDLMVTLRCDLFND
jgi:hypothetical protein